MNPTLTNACLLLAWYAGHCELWTAWLNRVYANPWPRRRLDRWRRWHDGALLLGPPLLLGWIGCWRPGVLRGGRWTEMDLPWKVYASLCALGFVSLVANSVWRRLRPQPRAIVGRESQVLDLADQLGGRPIGSGRHQGMARLGFNQAFELDITTRTIHVSGLPPEWDGFSIVQWTDLHLTGTIDRSWFEAVVDLTNRYQPDLAVCTGDLVDDMDLLDWLPDTLGRIEAKLGRCFILGNHDWHLQPEKIRQAAIDDAGWSDVAGESLAWEHNGQRLEIGGTELPWMGDFPQWGPKHDGTLRLLLSHTPDNIGWAARQDVDLVLAGHNHGGQVCVPLIGPIYSPSRYGLRYVAGDFQVGSTLMIVSRGLSGRHPLRYLCRPELVRVVFKSQPDR
jgi:predicted MPP superfamily phosphohydrolase